jgi:hypothetical protein
MFSRLVGTFFRNMSSKIPEAKIKEANQALLFVNSLKNKGDAESLKQALREVDEIKSKYPFCFDTARVVRGEIADDLLNKLHTGKPEKQDNGSFKL